ncbi:hypothetical protein AJ80_06331 [Polytolypa hystricis UAMH7299]|uniref:Uncharacterized protein n=1 Tax=Polytolypa hystricis (strain UAMH7299) TaxID=1447883 RepID=A0A2B7XXW5_POLH7|nr:hypothetical protein AJ80_06331 [Polytolypa hystricis UAMH7299]
MGVLSMCSPSSARGIKRENIYLHDQYLGSCSAFLALIFNAGAFILMILTLLGGAQDKNPLDRTWFLEADTSNIPGARDTSRWTFWNICGVKNGRNDCPGTSPAFPLNPPAHSNFDTTQNIPHQFIGTRKYFYLTRFMFAFMLIGLFFVFVALVSGLAALCTRVGSWISTVFITIGLILQIITASLMTAAYVQGRRNFNSNGQHAKIGVKAFAWMWTAVALLWLASMFYCLGGVGGRKREGPHAKKPNQRRGRFGGGRRGQVNGAVNGGEKTAYV